MFSFFKTQTKDLSKCKFDHNSFVNDSVNGISKKERQRKIRNLDYWIEVGD